MAYSNKKIRKIAKRVEEVGIRETAIEFGIKESSVERRVREYKQLGREKVEKTEEWYKDNKDFSGLVVGKESSKPQLILPDLHAPYHHPQALEFFKWVQELRGCRERVGSVGDIWDFHSMSFHKNEPDAMSPEEEYDKILEFSDELCSVFPQGDVVLGNHCDIPKRKMVDAGLAPSLLKNPNELYGMSDLWSIHPMYYVIEPDTWDVLVEHGVGSGGKYGCANTSKEKRCSYVQGHTHSNAAVIYSSNHKDTTFAMNVGCCVDSSSLAMRYGKYSTRKGVLGCGVVYSGSHAEFVPMSSWPGFRG